jgi:hypothetical protein
LLELRGVAQEEAVHERPGVERHGSLGVARRGGLPKLVEVDTDRGRIQPHFGGPQE